MESLTPRPELENARMLHRRPKLFGTYCRRKSFVHSDSLPEKPARVCCTPPILSGRSVLANNLPIGRDPIVGDKGLGFWQR